MLQYIYIMSKHTQIIMIFIACLSLCACQSTPNPQDLLEKLDQGKYSCIVMKNSELRTFSQVGVKDLYQMVNEKDEFAQGAVLVDKIVGKGAASLIVLAGIKEVITHKISVDGLAVLKAANISVYYEEEIEMIYNKRGDDICPVEKLVKDCQTAEEAFPLIEGFVKQMR